MDCSAMNDSGTDGSVKSLFDAIVREILKAPNSYKDDGLE